MPFRLNQPSARAEVPGPATSSNAATGVRGDVVDRGRLLDQIRAPRPHGCEGSFALLLGLLLFDLEQPGSSASSEDQAAMRDAPTSSGTPGPPATSARSAVGHCSVSVQLVRVVGAISRRPSGPVNRVRKVPLGTSPSGPGRGGIAEPDSSASSASSSSAPGPVSDSDPLTSPPTPSCPVDHSPEEILRSSGPVERSPGHSLSDRPLI